MGKWTINTLNLSVDFSYEREKSRYLLYGYIETVFQSATYSRLCVTNTPTNIVFTWISLHSRWSTWKSSPTDTKQRWSQCLAFAIKRSNFEYIKFYERKTPTLMKILGWTISRKMVKKSVKLQSFRNLTFSLEKHPIR